MKVYTQDKTIKILLSLIIIGLFLNFFKPTIKDALAADIDCLIMKDELMQRIALSENRLEEGIRMNGKFMRKKLHDYEEKYGVEIIFCENRHSAEEKAIEIFEKILEV